MFSYKYKYALVLCRARHTTHHSFNSLVRGISSHQSHSSSTVKHAHHVPSLSMYITLHPTALESIQTNNNITTINKHELLCWLHPVYPSTVDKVSIISTSTTSTQSSPQLSSSLSTDINTTETSLWSDVKTIGRHSQSAWAQYKENKTTPGMCHM